jgi:hypothetical protein
MSVGYTPTDYRISFKSVQGNMACFVNRLFVKPIKGKQGLAKIIVKAFNRSNALVAITDALEGRILRFYVPKTEVIENKSLITSVPK